MSSPEIVGIVHPPEGLGTPNFVNQLFVNTVVERKQSDVRKGAAPETANIITSLDQKVSLIGRQIHDLAISRLGTASDEQIVFSDGVKMREQYAEILELIEDTGLDRYAGELKSFAKFPSVVFGDYSTIIINGTDGVTVKLEFPLEPRISVDAAKKSNINPHKIILTRGDDIIEVIYDKTNEAKSLQMKVGKTGYLKKNIEGDPSGMYQEDQLLDVFYEKKEPKLQRGNIALRVASEDKQSSFQVFYDYPNQRVARINAGRVVVEKVHDHMTLGSNFDLDLNPLAVQVTHLFDAIALPETPKIATA